MSDRLHNALKSEVVETKTIQNFQLALAKLQWGKNDYGFSVHIQSNTWISSGIQGSELLQHLGFGHSTCSFLNGECWVKSVSEDFRLSEFANTFESAFNGIRDAEKKLNLCGLRLRNERSSGVNYYGRGSGSYYGDGHTATSTPQKMKEGADDHFDFVLTFQETPNEKGWTVHRHPKEEGITPDFAAASRFLDIKRMEECPQFDFNECFWSFISYNGDQWGDGNANAAHSYFEAHPKNFTEAVQQLVSSQSVLKPYGLNLLEDHR